MWTSILMLFLLGALVSLALTPLAARLAVKLGAVDAPGGRKIHTQPVPRLGGVSVVASLLITALLGAAAAALGWIELPVGGQPWVPLIAGALIVFAAGVWDDVRPLPAWAKLAAQSLAAACAIAWGVRFDRISFLGETGIEAGLWAVPMTFLWIVAVTNAFNLIDGLDGLAAGLASIAAGTSAVVFLMRGNESEAILLFAVLGVLVGFLRYNFHPAKIFLGDSGSLVIGYLLALTAITGSQKGVTALAIVFPLLVFGLPLADTALSMLRRYVGANGSGAAAGRATNGKLASLGNMFRADQQHIHHRLLEMGFSHRRAVLLLYGLGLALAGLAFLTVVANGRNAGLVLLLVALATYIGVSKLGYREVQLFRAESLLRLYERIGLHERFFLGFVDLVLIAGAYWGAFLIKYEGAARLAQAPWYEWLFPLALAIHFAVFYAFGLYSGVWRALSTGDLLRVAAAVGTGAALTCILGLTATPPDGATSFFVIEFLLLNAFMMVSRGAHRVLDYLRFGQDGSGRKAVIYGAGRGGQLVLRELSQNGDLGFRPIGFVDDDPRLQGCTVNRLPVLGGHEALPSILARHPGAAVIVSTSTIQPERLRAVAEVCRAGQVPVYAAQLHLRELTLEPSLCGEGPGQEAHLDEWAAQPPQGTARTLLESAKTK